MISNPASFRSYSVPFARVHCSQHCTVHCTILFLLCFLVSLALTQESAKVIIEARSDPPKRDRIYSATVSTDVSVGKERIIHTANVTLSTIQGTEGPFSLQLIGNAEVTGVKSEQVKSWSIRSEGKDRFLDFQADPETVELIATVTLQSEKLSLPILSEISHFGKGKAASFSNTVKILYQDGLAGKLKEQRGFFSISEVDDRTYHTVTGGRLLFDLYRDESQPPPASITGASLTGFFDPNSDSISFRYRGRVQVTEENATLAFLSGEAALTTRPAGAGYEIKLVSNKRSLYYQLSFPEVGEFPVDIEFAARVKRDKNGVSAIDLNVENEGVLPVSISGLDSDIEFVRGSMERKNQDWSGFLPPDGKVGLSWKPATKAADGKLFFSTSGTIETQIGTGLARQNHRIEYRVLQGELTELGFALVGEGEVVSVAGNQVRSWGVTDDNKLEITLSEAIDRYGFVDIKTQADIGRLPARLSPLRLEPAGSIRHAGFIRLVNDGSVRIEPSGLEGLTQLSPDKFPGEAIEARQTFVYRYPSAKYRLDVGCDRIQPEVHVSEISTYLLSRAERTISSAIELDIRDAPIRDWNMLIPSGYSVVSVEGASLSDYILSADENPEGRKLKVIFSGDVSGRKLIRLMLEKNAPAESGEWVIPRLNYPDAHAVRGDIGISGDPGFRLSVTELNELTERPLSSFPGEGNQLQHYFRLKDPAWNATLSIEVLEKNVQADVFHLYSLSEGTARGSVLINYFITGAPSSEFQIHIPDGLENVVAEGKDLRSQKIEDNTLSVLLHQAVIGPFTLLVTFSETANQSFSPGSIYPEEIDGESGYIQLVSPNQVTIGTAEASNSLLELDHLELPPEFRLFSASPSLGIWQYNERPFILRVDLNWLEPDDTLDQVVEFAEARTLVSRENETVTDLTYYVKSRDNRPFSIILPSGSKIWDVRTNQQSVAPRKTGDYTQIPLGLTRNSGNLAEVSMRLGNTIEKGNLALPTVSVPVLKTGWRVDSEGREVTRLQGDRRIASRPVLPPSGFAWLGENGLIHLSIIVLAVVLGLWLRGRKSWVKWLSLLLFLGAVALAGASALKAYRGKTQPAPLRINVPVLSAGESLEVKTDLIPDSKAAYSFGGMALSIIGLGLALFGFLGRMGTGKWSRFNQLFVISGLVVLGFGLLVFANGAHLFFIYLSALIVLFLIVPMAANWARITPKIAAAIIGWMGVTSGNGEEPEPDYQSFDRIEEVWSVDLENNQLTSNVKVTLSGKGGDQFILLRSPAVLVSVESGDLILRKGKGAAGKARYLVILPSDDPFALAEEGQREISFAYQLDITNYRKGFALPTENAAIHSIKAEISEKNWEVVVPGAAKLEQADQLAKIHLLPLPKHTISLRPKERDPASEPTEFYVEGQQLYLPSPGVVDGIHQFEIRPARGLIRQLEYRIPAGFTVSDVSGPVHSWRFNPEEMTMTAALDPPQSDNFSIRIETQSGLGSFPTDITLSPMLIDSADGHTGIVALAFRGDAQPESISSQSLSGVNLDDFDRTLLPKPEPVLHRAFRYKENGGDIDANLTEVSPEIRITTKQLISLGDENLLYRINFLADISRAGIFSLSFPLIDGFEVNSISGGALDHWSETDDQNIVLHLKGKTMGREEFSITLNAAPPNREEVWTLPGFTVNEADRQNGDLIVQPATGVRLSLVDRRNVSESDPRDLGAKQKGALAFRLLQKDWSVSLDIETLAPRVTGEVLQNVTVREAQIRTSIAGVFEVENAAIKTLRVRLPITSDDSIKTLRADGRHVSGITQVEEEEDLWEIQLKRWITGAFQVRLEWEERVSAEDGNFTRSPVVFPDARQVKYYFGVRPTGRIELELSDAPQPWRRVDWKTVPRSLRESSNQMTPVLALRARSNPGELILLLERHSLAEALKLRMSSGDFRTVLSPYGTRLTSVDLAIEVIQRGHLAISLPTGSEWFGLFVNDESVDPVKVAPNRWQFPVLPDTNGRSARVFAIYLEPGKPGNSLEMSSPHFNIPMENVTWEVLSPSQLVLASHEGDLNYIDHELVKNQARETYLALARERRKEQSSQAVDLLEKANRLLRDGQQTLARQALQSVANRSGLDAASNEDARVQLETLQTQQALVALNTRRQRMFLDRNPEEVFGPGGQQVRESASRNPVIQMGDLNFRSGDLSQLLQGNSTEDLMAFRKIATRIVEQQRGEEIASPGLDIAPPYEGNRYQFRRGVQVRENAPLVLNLTFKPTFGSTGSGRGVLVAGLVIIAMIAIGMAGYRPIESDDR